jgi:hypothetical protein
MEAKVWKTTGGPFYPDLQRDVDLLVGKGMIEVSDIGHVETHDEGFRISCSYAINSDFAGPVLSLLETLPDEQEMLEFCQELMLALSGMSDEQIEAAFRQDATYSYRRTGPQNVIEFDLEGRNFSAIAAEKIGELLPTHAKAGPGEKVHLYMRHLRTRLAGGR